jgi:hypothetical protein
VGIDTEIELIRAKARALVSHLNRDLAYSVLQASIARLYHSVGYDAVPKEEEGKPMADLARLMQARFMELEAQNFAPARPPQSPAVAIGEIRGAPERGAALLREGAHRVLELSKLRLADPEAADVRLEFEVAVEDPKEGKRGARIDIRLVRAGGDGAAEFKTTMSEPLDDEQWRALGEGAAYRVLDQITVLRARKPSARPTAPPRAPTRASDALLFAASPDAQGEPVTLNLERELRTTIPDLPAGGVVE